MTNTNKLITKDSGVRWIGKIPENWDLQRLKSVIKTTRNGDWGDDPKGDSNDVVCIRVADFDKENFGINTNNLTIRNIENNDKLLLNKDDLILEKSGGGDLQLVGRIVLYNQSLKAVTSNFLSTIRLKDNIANPRFFYYLLKFYYDSSINYKSIKQTTGIQNIDTDSYFQEPVPIPDISIQKKISDYLDIKSDQIKTFVENKKKLIKLLEEQKKTIIYDAVTKGLDKNIKTKSSGVEWLGDIPENWEVRKLKTVAKIKTGTTQKNPDKNPVFLDGNIPWYSPGDFQDSMLLPDKTRKMINEGFTDDNTIIYPENTVFVVGIGATTGKFCISKNRCSSNQQLNAIIFNKKIIDPFFGLYYFSSIRKIVKSEANEATLPILNQMLTKNLLIIHPPISDQKCIINYIDEEISKIDKVITTVKQEIGLIEEYKKSLIYHAVTGKIEKLLIN